MVESLDFPFIPRNKTGGAKTPRPPKTTILSRVDPTLGSAGLTDRSGKPVIGDQAYTRLADSGHIPPQLDRDNLMVYTTGHNMNSGNLETNSGFPFRIKTRPTPEAGATEDSLRELLEKHRPTIEAQSSLTDVVRAITPKYSESRLTKGFAYRDLSELINPGCREDTSYYRSGLFQVRRPLKRGITEGTVRNIAGLTEPSISTYRAFIASGVITQDQALGFLKLPNTPYIGSARIIPEPGYDHPSRQREIDNLSKFIGYLHSCYTIELPEDLTDSDTYRRLASLNRIIFTDYFVDTTGITSEIPETITEGTLRNWGKGTEPTISTLHQLMITLRNNFDPRYLAYLCGLYVLPSDFDYSPPKYN